MCFLAMIDRLSGVVLLPTDGAPAGPPVDISLADGRIAAVTPAADTPSRRLLAIPALVNAHDHARPLSPTSFGAAGKPLETWLLRLAAMPAIDPYLGALAAFGRAARAGAGSVMAHYTRFHGPMPPVDEAREIARAAADVGVRVTLAVFMRDRNPLVYGGDESVLTKLPANARSVIEAQFLPATPSVEEQIARVEAIAAAVESAAFCVQFGPNGPQWCSDALLKAIAEASRRTGRRVHMHLLETRYQRAFADRAYPEGVVAAPEGTWAPVAAPDARPLRLRAARRARRDRRLGRGHRDKPKLEFAFAKRDRSDFGSDAARLSRCARR